jgi:hypothetical protein
MVAMSWSSNEKEHAGVNSSFARLSKTNIGARIQKSTTTSVATLFASEETEFPD